VPLHASHSTRTCVTPQLPRPVRDSECFSDECSLISSRQFQWREGLSAESAFLNSRRRRANSCGRDRGIALRPGANHSWLSRWDACVPTGVPVQPVLLRTCLLRFSRLHSFQVLSENSNSYIVMAASACRACRIARSRSILAGRDLVLSRTRCLVSKACFKGRCLFDAASMLDGEIPVQRGSGAEMAFLTTREIRGARHSVSMPCRDRAYGQFCSQKRWLSDDRTDPLACRCHAARGI
jgi:hypothetical protein